MSFSIVITLEVVFNEVAVVRDAVGVEEIALRPNETIPGRGFL